MVELNATLAIGVRFADRIVCPAKWHRAFKEWIRQAQRGPVDRTLPAPRKVIPASWLTVPAWVRRMPPGTYEVKKFQYFKYLNGSRSGQDLPKTRFNTENLEFSSHLNQIRLLPEAPPLRIACMLGA
jgi:hypothetical protein